MSTSPSIVKTTKYGPVTKYFTHHTERDGKLVEAKGYQITIDDGKQSIQHFDMVTLPTDFYYVNWEDKHHQFIAASSKNFRDWSTQPYITCLGCDGSMPSHP